MNTAYHAMVISGDMILWLAPPQGIGILTPETKLVPDSIDLGGNISDAAPAGDKRKFLLRYGADWALLTFDDQYKHSLRVFSLELPPPKLKSVAEPMYGNFVADDSYVYGIRSERNEQGDQNIVLLRGAL